MNDRVELLNESYSLFEKNLSKIGRLRINRSIESKVCHLERAHGLATDEILSDLWDHFQSREHYRKFDPGKTRLSTFVANYTNLALENLKRRYDIRKKNGCEIPLSVLEDRGFEVAVDRTTPEDIVIAKELLKLMLEHFVLLEGSCDFQPYRVRPGGLT